MAHVRIQRFAAGERQKDCAQKQEGSAWLVDRETDRMHRIDCHQHARRTDNAQRPHGTQGQEPHDSDGPEQAPDTGGAVALHREQGDQYRNRDGNDEVFEMGRRHTYSFNRREYRDRRRKDCITIEQGGSEYADHTGEQDPARPLAQYAIGECGQGEDATFALVVEAQYDPDILERDHEHQGPEHGRKCGQHMGVRDREIVAANERFLERV